MQRLEESVGRFASFGSTVGLPRALLAKREAIVRVESICVAQSSSGWRSVSVALQFAAVSENGDASLSWITANIALRELAKFSILRVILCLEFRNDIYHKWRALLRTRRTAKKERGLLFPVERINCLDRKKKHRSRRLPTRIVIPPRRS